MKKAAIIFLVLIYAASAMGWSVKADYCCEKLQSVKLVLAEGVKDKNGCCKVKYQSLKVNDFHAAANVIHAPGLTYVLIGVPRYSFELNAMRCSATTHCESIHAPPLISSTPQYISNCIFRI